MTSIQRASFCTLSLNQHTMPINPLSNHISFRHIIKIVPTDPTIICYCCWSEKLIIRQNCIRIHNKMSMMFNNQSRKVFLASLKVSSHNENVTRTNYCWSECRRINHQMSCKKIPCSEN